MNKMNPKVDGFVRKNKQWGTELQKLREIVLASELTEEVKWRVPVYTLGGKNVAFLGAFKDNCVLSFVKGALLKDPRKILTKPGENTQSARVIRFANASQIDDLKPVLHAYIQEAIEVEKAGLKVAFKKPGEFDVPEEFQQKLDASAKLKKAFEGLTPGRQRMYLLYFAGAKQAKTREARVDKYVDKILAGKGMDD